jgi:molybdopterin-synthase adenylyltransferase
MGPSSHQAERHSRQITIPEIGPEGQRKLARARVLVFGAGGLASAAIYYLACAGVGTIGIADDDRIELSNLNRQILHNPHRIGMLKAFSAQHTIMGFSPETHVVAYPRRVESVTEMVEVIKEFDAVIDCTDNFESRDLINESCILARKPWVYGAVSGFEGQVMTIVTGMGPCYRCLYPSLPQSSDNSARPGVIGVSPGFIGVLQASEIIKHILGKGSLLVGRLLYADLLEMDFSELHVSKNPTCRYCGGHMSMEG